MITTISRALERDYETRSQRILIIIRIIENDIFNTVKRAYFIQFTYVIVFTLADTHMSNTYASLTVNENTIYMTINDNDRTTYLNFVGSYPPSVRLRGKICYNLIFFYITTLIVRNR